MSDAHDTVREERNGETQAAPADEAAAVSHPEPPARVGAPSSSIHGAIVALALCAVGIELCLLWLDRVAVHKAIAWPAAESLIRGLFRPFETLFGSIHEDTSLTREQVKVANLLTGFVPAFLLHVFATWLVLFRLPTNDRRVLKLLVGAAIVFRVTLVPFPPILETDLHRYVWDGAVSATHVNPYKYAPFEVSQLGQPGRRELYTPEELGELETLAQLLVKHPQLAAHFPRINHPKIPTIYPPLAQLLFSVAFRIAPGSDVPIKALVVLVDLAIVGLIVLLLAELGLNRCQVVVYAWSPLILKEYANTGHYDPLATLMVLVGLLLILRRMPVLPGIALALGTASKFYPLVVTLVLAPWLGVLGIVAYVATLAMMYVPYLGIGWRMFDGLRAMAADWEFNSSLFAVAERTILQVFSGSFVARLVLARKSAASLLYDSDDVGVDAFLVAKVVCAGVGLAFVIWLLTRAAKEPAAPVLRAFAVTAALVLLSPVSDPWYYAWVMPYAALFPSASWLYLSGSMVVYYLYFWSYPWGYLSGARPVEYLPFYVLLTSEHAETLRGWGAAVRGALGWPLRQAAAELKALRGAGLARRKPS